MTAVYLLLTLSPLVSIGMQSKPFFQALSRECSGDCRLCGCATERSASRSCCCWQKKLAEAKKRANVAASCTPATSSASPKAASCCQKPATHEDHDNEAAVSPQTGDSPGENTDTISISTCPCGSGQDLAFSGTEKPQHLPFRFLSGIPLQNATHFAHLPPERLSSRHCEPPTPPPESFTSS